MAELSEEEAKTLEKLLAKKDAPEESGVGKVVNVMIDLGDPDQVRRGLKLGFLNGDDLDDDDDDDQDDGDGKTKTDDDDDSEKTPAPKARRGYFEKKKEDE